MDNQHKHIPGYRDLSSTDVETIKVIKEAEKFVGKLWASIRDASDVDMREMALAKTYMEEGFSRFVKAVAKPDDPYTTGE